MRFTPATPVITAVSSVNPEHRKGIRNEVKGTHEVNDGGDDPKNRVSWRAELACELSTKKTKKYLQAFPRSKEKFVAFF